MNRDIGKTLFAILAIGLVAGLGAAGFLVALDGASAVFLGGLAHYVPMTAGNEAAIFDVETGGEPIRWLLLVVPIVGGLLAGWITFALAPEVEGHGTDAAIEAYHFKEGAIRRRVPLLKALTSALTIGTGGSGGREGPIAQIGSGFASMLSDWLGLPHSTRRTVMAAGMAAGIGAIFHAPLAGAIFAAEVMYRGPYIEPNILLPAFAASIVSYCVFGSIFGFDPLFATPDYRFEDPRLLLPFLLLALISAVGAIAYTKFFYGVRRLMFTRVRLPNHVKPALGGIVVGVVGFFLPEAMGAGYGVLQACFNADAGTGAVATVQALPSYGGVAGVLGGISAAPALAAAGLLATIAVGKIVTTGFAIGSGGSGGVFGPAVVIGGALGAATGYVCQELFPSLAVHPGAFAIVGMASFFAAAANTPISTIIMVSEMTGNYDLLLPSMFVCATAYGLCRRFTLYERQLGSPFEAPANLGAMGRSFLSRVSVADALDLVSTRSDRPVRINATLAEIGAAFAEPSQTHVVVVDEAGYPVGVISREAIEMLDGVVNLPLIADDIVTPTPYVASDDTVMRVVSILAGRDVRALPAVEKDDFRRVIGVIGDREVIQVYDHYADRDVSPA